MFKNPRYRMLTDYIGMALVVLALCVFFSVKTERFLQTATFTTIANQSADTMLLAVGMTFVLIIAGIDLSVGSVLALCGAVLGICLTKGQWPLPLAIAAALATGAICGAINGFVVIRWRIPSFIVTLGMLEIARGGAALITNSESLYIGERIEVISDIGIGDLKLPFFIALGVVVVAQLVLTRTACGRHMLAVGANEDAARLSGLRTRGITWSVFVISGFMAGLASIFLTARMGTASPNSGAGYELQAIAAVVIGGTSLMGGRGSVVSSFFGVAIIAILAYGLTQMDTGDPAKQIVTGCVIVLAVILDVYRTRLGKKALA